MEFQKPCLQNQLTRSSEKAFIYFFLFTPVALWRTGDELADNKLVDKEE